MFTPQVEDLKYTINEISGLREMIERGLFQDISDDLVDAILNEAGRFSQEVIAPLNRTGDETGCKFDPEKNAVTTPPGWKQAYDQWVEGGWPSLPCPQDFGGQNLPMQISLAAQELWNSATMAFGLGPLLTQGAVNALKSHGTDELKQKFLHKMVSGEWTGTMCLTEPQAGSDLGALKTRAEPAGDGTYKITGTKIFITYGEHDLTDNIVHLVLACLPDAPRGEGMMKSMVPSSLFVVPKFLLNEDGSPGRRNDVKCVGIEHKLGIHGSPTATMQFGDDGGATGYLVGGEHRGLSCMFTMMNDARLHVGMQGVAVAERAFQQALAYAFERKQGQINGKNVTIINHPDVRRMLLDMKAKIAAARALCYQCAAALDLEKYSTDEGEKRSNKALAALLTPVVKAFGTDIGVEVASTGIQVHGGMGFIEETGAAQHLRDVRITPIYEGTNGIQALDLVMRKLPMGKGGVYKAWAKEQAKICKQIANIMPDVAARLAPAIDELNDTTEWLLQRRGEHDARAIASTTNYLRAFALVAATAALAKGVINGSDRADIGARKKILAYFAANHLPKAAGLCNIVKHGSAAIIDKDNDPLAM